MITLILSGLFVVKNVDWDKNKFNILLEQKSTGNLIAHWENFKKYEENDKVFLKIKAECEESYEVLEGNGTKGWRPEDDYYVNRKTLICNSITVENL